MKNNQTALLNSPFSRIHRLEDITSSPSIHELVANADERSAIARALDLDMLTDMKFHYELKKYGKDRYKLHGKMQAEVTQKCVVTLDLVESSISESIDIEFWPPEQVRRLEDDTEDDGTPISLDGPEPLEGDHIDVGHLAYEHLAAALDPYPRKEGVKFDWKGPEFVEETDLKDKPFAELARLKRDQS